MLNYFGAQYSGYLECSKYFRNFVLRVLLVLEDKYCSYSQYSQYIGFQWVGGETSLLYDPGSELRLGERDNRERG